MSDNKKCTFPQCDCEIQSGGEGTSFAVCKHQLNHQRTEEIDLEKYFSNTENLLRAVQYIKEKTGYDISKSMNKAQSNPTNTEEHKAPCPLCGKTVPKTYDHWGKHVGYHCNECGDLDIKQSQSGSEQLKSLEKEAEEKYLYPEGYHPNATNLIVIQQARREGYIAGAQRTVESGNTESLIYWREQAIERLRLLKEKEQQIEDLKLQLQAQDANVEILLWQKSELQQENAQLKGKVAEAWDAAVIATQEAGESISADHMGASCTIYDEEKLNSVRAEYLKIVTDKTENP